MEIGLFQLENLVVARSPFLLLDIRRRPIELSDLGDLLKSAESVEIERVLEHLAASNKGKAYPVILMDEDGKTSPGVAKKLEADGYTNVYTIGRGAEGLISEL